MMFSVKQICFFSIKAQRLFIFFPSFFYFHENRRSRRGKSLIQMAAGFDNCTQDIVPSAPRRAVELQCLPSGKPLPLTHSMAVLFLFLLSLTYLPSLQATVSDPLSICRCLLRAASPLCPVAGRTPRRGTLLRRDCGMYVLRHTLGSAGIRSREL